MTLNATPTEVVGQSKRTIVTLAVVGAALSWLVVWARPTLQVQDEAALTVLSLAVLCIGVGLRIAAGLTPSSHDWSNEITWLCSYFAQANVLGFIAVAGPSSPGIIPSLLISVVVESLLFSKMPHRLRHCRFSDSPCTTEQVASITTESYSLVSDSDGEEELCTRATFEESEANGQRVLRGWVRFELGPGDKTSIITIGFTPAFPSSPELELDCETNGEQQCEAHIEHLIPCAARVLVKRTSSQDSLHGRLSWHAIESNESHLSHLLKSTLP